MFKGVDLGQGEPSVILGKNLGCNLGFYLFIQTVSFLAI